MSSITNHGMMQALGSQLRAWQTTQHKLVVEFSQQPKGTLYIKNQTTGAEKRISLSNIASGAVVFDGTDDTGAQADGDLFTIEYSGKAPTLGVAVFAYQAAPSTGFNFVGNGSSEASGWPSTANE